MKINGQTEGFIATKRGLRQEDPFFPYLFVLCMEVFTQLLDQAVRDNQKKVSSTMLKYQVNLSLFCK